MAENKWVTRVINPISGVITLLVTGDGPTLHQGMGEYRRQQPLVADPYPPTLFW